MKKRSGGPKPKYGKNATKIIGIRLTPESGMLVDLAARMEGKTTVDFVRELIIAQATNITGIPPHDVTQEVHDDNRP